MLTWRMRVGLEACDHENSESGECRGAYVPGDYRTVPWKCHEQQHPPCPSHKYPHLALFSFSTLPSMEDERLLQLTFLAIIVITCRPQCKFTPKERKERKGRTAIAKSAIRTQLSSASLWNVPNANRERVDFLSRT